MCKIALLLAPIAVPAIGAFLSFIPFRNKLGIAIRHFCGKRHSEKVS
jgi:hypothetical protein